MSKKSSDKSTVLDGTDFVLGRICSLVAKRLLNGEKIALINAEKIVISGNKLQVLKNYVRKTQIKTRTAPWRGPFQPRRPDTLVKRTVRGMLPRQNDRGFKALTKLKVYIGVPPHLSDVKPEDLSSLQPKLGLEKIKGRFITIGELSKQIGWNPIV